MYTCFESLAQAILFLYLCQRMLTIFKSYLQVRGSSHQIRRDLRKVETWAKPFHSTESFKSAHKVIASIKRVLFDKGKVLEMNGLELHNMMVLDLCLCHRLLLQSLWLVA